MFVSEGDSFFCWSYSDFVDVFWSIDKDVRLMLVVIEFIFVGTVVSVEISSLICGEVVFL